MVSAKYTGSEFVRCNMLRTSGLEVRERVLKKRKVGMLIRMLSHAEGAVSTRVRKARRD